MTRVRQTAITHTHHIRHTQTTHRQCALKMPSVHKYRSYIKILVRWIMHVTHTRRLNTVMLLIDRCPSLIYGQNKAGHKPVDLADREEIKEFLKKAEKVLVHTILHTHAYVNSCLYVRDVRAHLDTYIHAFKACDKNMYVVRRPRQCISCVPWIVCAIFTMYATHHTQVECMPPQAACALR